MVTTDGVVAKYLEHLRVRNLQPTTVYNRRQALHRLGLWAGSPILYLTEDDLSAWQAQRMREIQPEPVRTEMSHARQFYRWAQREGFRHDDPTIRLELPRVARRVPRPIRDAKLADALAGADPYTAAILGLAAFGGLRAIEIARLAWPEVGMEDRTPMVRIARGKGGHGRLVPISSALASLLAQLPARRGPVIPRLDGRPGQCEAHRISSRANEYLHSLGITETLHQCRHRFATTAYQSCQDIRAVQDLLGHASPATTAIYAMASSEVSRAAVEAAGQLAA